MLWAWHLYLFTLFIFGWDESSLWGMGQKIPLHAAPSTSKCTLLLCINFAGRIQPLFKLLVQAEQMNITTVYCSNLWVLFSSIW